MNRTRNKTRGNRTRNTERGIPYADRGEESKLPFYMPIESTHTNK